MLPGGGALLASFAAYALEKKLSRKPERVRQGRDRGRRRRRKSANNAGAQTSFIPMLTLGLPSNAVMALMIGAMIIQGISRGRTSSTEQPELFWGLIASMWIGNLMLLVLNLPLVGIWVKLLTVPYRCCSPAIIVFCGDRRLHAQQQRLRRLYLWRCFGLLGYVLIKLDCEPAPLLLGFVLGPMLEEHLRRAMLLSRGDPTVFVTRPISAALLLPRRAVLLVALPLPAIAGKRQQVFVE